VLCRTALLSVFTPLADVKIEICGLKGRSPAEHGLSVEDSTRLKHAYCTTVHPREMSGTPSPFRSFENARYDDMIRMVTLCVLHANGAPMASHAFAVVEELHSRLC
jgi:hypothetical protein